jgi:hypothetical protein
VHALAEHPARSHGQPCFLENFAHSGNPWALARLELAAGQHPRRGAVVRAAAHQQYAAMLDDDSDSDSLAIRFGHGAEDR